jgi:hypothetical protein
MANNELNGKDDVFLQELEDGVRKILKSAKASKADKLSAIGHGVKLALIKHRINGGDDKAGFFDK